MIPGRVYRLDIGHPDNFLVVSVRDRQKQVKLKHGEHVLVLSSAFESVNEVLMANGCIGRVISDYLFLPPTQEGSE